MTARSSLTVVLAAGEGTRMRSSVPKVLHPVAGQPLLVACAAGRAQAEPAQRLPWSSGPTTRRSSKR